MLIQICYKYIFKNNKKFCVELFDNRINFISSTRELSIGRRILFMARAYIYHQKINFKESTWFLVDLVYQESCIFSQFNELENSLSSCKHSLGELISQLHNVANYENQVSSEFQVNFILTEIWFLSEIWETKVMNSRCTLYHVYTCVELLHCILFLNVIIDMLAFSRDNE